jgi:small-conductance mechanosensitive channel
MDWKTFTKTVLPLLRKELFAIGTTKVTLATILTALLIILITYALSVSVQRGVVRLLKRRGVESEGTVHATRRIIHYFILLGGLVAALQTFGIDLSTLFAAGAVFAVGFGFAMQTIAQNFVSGLILLVERSIRAGDVLEVDGRLVRVERMGIRSTVARTRLDEQLIIPNSTLVQGTVKNFTMNDKRYLLRATVGVVYGADMKQVRQVLEQVVESLSWRDDKQEARILMKEFGDSSVNFDLLIPMTDPWQSRRRLSDANEAIWWGLKKAGITIAFPQLDVHFDPPVEESLRLVAEAGSAA